MIIPPPLWLLLIACALLWPAAGQADALTSYPYNGVTLITRTETSPRPLTMHLVIIDLNAPGIGFTLTPPGGSRDTVRQTTIDFLNQVNAQIAINAHFYVPFGSNDASVVGLAVSQGIVYSPFEPQPIGTGIVDQSYAILPYAPALNIDSS